MDESGVFPGGCRGAVSFTYDDALHVHLDHAMPDLEAAGLRGTFYVPTHNSQRDAWQLRKSEWKAAAQRGHEIGNHTQYHPCSGELNWVKPERRLESYDMAKMERELVAASEEITLVTGIIQPMTFAYTCSHDFVGPERTSFRPVTDKLFIASRIGRAKLDGPLNDPRICDFTGLPSLGVVLEHSLIDLKLFADLAIERGQWAIFMFHGVGGEHRMDVTRENHRSLCAHVASRMNDLWCDTVLNVAKHIRAATNRPWLGESKE